MDPSLLKERDAFKARAMKLPTVEVKRKAKDDDMNKSSKKPKNAFKPKSSASSFDYKASSGSSQYKFGILTRIVKYMMQRHMEGDFHPLGLDDILDETNQLDVGQSHRRWLSTEALANNPKIEVVNGDTYKFRPKFNIRDRKGLMKLLDKNDRLGMGGIYLTDIEESLPRAQTCLKKLGERITYITRPDKKQILFYNDTSYQFEVEDELKKLWRSATVEGTDENKIEEYLEKHKIASMQDIGGKKLPLHKRKKGGKRRKGQFKSHNDHMAGVLQDYSEAQK